MEVLSIIFRLALAALASAAGGGAAASVPILLLSRAWPAMTGLQDVLMALAVIPLVALFGGMFGAGLGMFIAFPWTLLAGTVLLVVSSRLGLRSSVPWLATGLLGGMVLAHNTRWGSIVIDLAGNPFLLVGGAVGGMAAAWLFRRTWLALAGAEKDDIPTF